MFRSYLWRPDRMQWVAGKGYGGCLFCDVARGKPGIPNKVIYRDDLAMVIMNMFPYNTGHLQVLPIRHAENLEDLTGDEYSRITALIMRSVMLLKKSHGPDGFNAGINLGEIAGHSIRHLHFHVVPRYAKEIGFMGTIGETKVMPETIEQTYKRLMKYVKVLEG